MKLTVTGAHNNKLAAQDGSVIADVFHDGLDSASAIAEEIKVRFNSHDKLVKALELAKSKLISLQYHGFDLYSEIDEINEALAAAKGE